MKETDRQKKKQIRYIDRQIDKQTNERQTDRQKRYIDRQTTNRQTDISMTLFRKYLKICVIDAFKDKRRCSRLQNDWGETAKQTENEMNNQKKRSPSINKSKH